MITKSYIKHFESYKIINKNNNRTFNLNLKFENNLINFLTKNEQKWTQTNTNECSWTKMNLVEHKWM